MHYGLTLNTPPAAEPISLNEAAAHCRIDSDVLAAEGGVLQGLIVAARSYVERVTGLQIVAATFTMTVDWFPGYAAPGTSVYPYGDFYAADRGWDEKRTIRLPKAPAAPTVVVNYIDTTGTLLTLLNTLYTVDNSSLIARLAPAYGQIWPVTRAIQNAVQITFTAGWVHTTVAASITAGTRTVTPGSMAGIAVGSVLTIDAGATQEIIVVTGVASTTFTAVFAQSHGAGSLVSAVPQPVRQAMLLLISHWNEHREAAGPGSMAEVPMAVDALLATVWTGQYAL